ncbi:MAG: hypothetical protein HQL52_00550 [Magnetococcales bacterium]|nr:hypothetical protein [Magnetococcales bacterium]
MIHDTQPAQFLFSQLQYYPGAEEFDLFKQEKNLDGNLFFAHDFVGSDYGFVDHVTGRMWKIVELWMKSFVEYAGQFYPDVAEYQDILDRLAGLPAAHMDLAGAWLRAGSPEQAEVHVNAALEGGYPHPGVGYNYLAIIAAFRQDQTAFEENLRRAGLSFNHSAIGENIRRYRLWLESGGFQSETPLKLMAHNNFELSQEATQPEMPERLDFLFSQGESQQRASGNGVAL